MSTNSLTRKQPHMTTDDKIERVARLVAEREHVAACEWSLREIDQLDQIDVWLKLYPPKVTREHRELVKFIVDALNK